ncbi:MAG: hypothetical protein AAGA38_03670 [Pseudomonadota bacterium]
MFPYWNFSPTIEYPLSGDVKQDIETSWFARMQGNPELEYKIITEVWSYGDQLGALTDVLLELCAQDGVTQTKAIKKLKEKVGQMEDTKLAARQQLRERAEKALKLLKDIDAEAHAQVLNAAKKDDA